jgi:hypothetical protein
LQVVPNVNLISNIGFGPNATHTHEVGVHSEMPITPIAFPLIHPNFVLANSAADEFICSDQIAPSFLKRQWRKVVKTWRLIFKCA